MEKTKKTQKAKKYIRDGSIRTKNGEYEITETFREELPSYPMMVHFLKSRTINLGNYESVKIEVGVDYPCTEKTYKSVMTKAMKYVCKELGTLETEILNGDAI
jgi:hypothetical protein